MVPTAGAGRGGDGFLLIGVFGDLRAEHVGGGVRGHGHEGLDAAEGRGEKVVRVGGGLWAREREVRIGLVVELQTALPFYFFRTPPFPHFKTQFNH